MKHPPLSSKIQEKEEKISPGDFEAFSPVQRWYGSISPPWGKIARCCIPLCLKIAKIIEYNIASL